MQIGKVIYTEVTPTRERLTATWQPERDRADMILGDVVEAGDGYVVDASLRFGSFPYEFPTVEEARSALIRAAQRRS